MHRPFIKDQFSVGLQVTHNAVSHSIHPGIEQFFRKLSSDFVGKTVGLKKYDPVPE